MTDEVQAWFLLHLETKWRAHGCFWNETAAAAMLDIAQDWEDDFARRIVEIVCFETPGRVDQNVLLQAARSERAAPHKAPAGREDKQNPLPPGALRKIVLEAWRRENPGKDIRSAPVFYQDLARGKAMASEVMEDGERQRRAVETLRRELTGKKRR